MSCQICLDPFNKINKKKVECPKCQGVCCRECLQTYILSELVDAHCFNCKNNFDFTFISNNCRSTFIDKEYYLHRENILLETQKSKFLQTQVRVDKQLQINSINSKIADITNENDQFYKQCIKEANQKYNEFVEKSKQHVEDLNEQMKKLNTEEYEKAEASRFYGKCPRDNCLGFINSSWKCMLCESKICRSCKESVTDNTEHQCDENTLETLKKIKSDSKACPNCKTNIFKIEGCAQMFCTHCKTAFNWNTLKIVVGHIHNPHFIEWQRTQERTEIHINECNDDPDRIFNIHPNVFRNIIPTERKYKNLLCFIECLYWITREFKYNRLTEKYNSVITNTEQIYEKIRFEYLYSNSSATDQNNKMSEEEFKRKLRIEEKKINKCVDIYNLYDMFTRTYCEITYATLSKIQDKQDYKKVIDTTIQEISELVEYTNNTSQQFVRKYNNNSEFIYLYINMDKNNNIRRDLTTSIISAKKFSTDATSVIDSIKRY